MRVLAKSTLAGYWARYSDAEDPLRDWYENAEKSVWASPNDITETCTGISILKDSRVCFNIKSNAYRLIVRINYVTGFAYIKWFGTHAEYSRIDADTVNSPNV